MPIPTTQCRPCKDHDHSNHQREYMSEKGVRLCRCECPTLSQLQNATVAAIMKRRGNS